MQNSLGSFSASSFRQFGPWLEAPIATGNDRKKSHEQAPESGVPRRANRVTSGPSDQVTTAPAMDNPLSSERG